MQKQPLTQQRLKELLAYNQATGQFHWRVSPRYNVPVGVVAGDRKGTVQIDGVIYGSARLVKLYLEGEACAARWPR